MEFEKNTLLFGADPTPRIVSIELGETGMVRVYRREVAGSTVADVEPFHPFVWADSDVVDLGIETEKLQSDLKYGWLVTVDSWKELIALRNGLKNAGRDFFAFTDPVQHYLTATGRTFFKPQVFKQRASGRGQIVLHGIGEREEIASGVSQSVAQCDQFFPAINRDQPAVFKTAFKLFGFDAKIQNIRVAPDKRVKRFNFDDCRSTFSPAINFNGSRFAQFNRDDPRRSIGAEEHGVLLKFHRGSRESEK